MTYPNKEERKKLKEEAQWAKWKRIRERKQELSEQAQHRDEIKQLRELIRAQKQIARAAELRAWAINQELAALLKSRKHLKSLERGPASTPQVP